MNITKDDILELKNMCTRNAELEKMFKELAYDAGVNAHLIEGRPDGVMTYDETALFNEIVSFSNDKVRERCKKLDRTFGVVFDVSQLAQNVMAGFIGLICCIMKAGTCTPYNVDIHFEDEYDKEDFEDYSGAVFRIMHAEKDLENIRYI